MSNVLNFPRRVKRSHRFGFILLGVSFGTLCLGMFGFLTLEWVRFFKHLLL
jgi:hypothetical protein